MPIARSQIIFGYWFRSWFCVVTHPKAPPCSFQAYADYMGFILTLNEGVKGKKLTSDYDVSEVAEALVSAVLPAEKAAAAPEIAVYLKESVGNPTRIDYGTGHEAAFAAFLCCLCKVGALRISDQLAIVFKVFNRYLQVMRKLQRTYRMEPAGSQGVWGLDDFQFLPFIWGSSQFIGKNIRSDDTLQGGCLHRKMKHGGNDII
ncbi:hypothetical protein GOODEAATRI_003350 [Goodea atripinnis]|uniref:Serine/threonine-protein phosphatase 2A activator n=1 Tax=Goodea atripinnis TaxID=208336 RepID=A0ABV0MF07_9TELE